MGSRGGAAPGPRCALAAAGAIASAHRVARMSVANELEFDTIMGSPYVGAGGEVKVQARRRTGNAVTWILACLAALAGCNRARDAQTAEPPDEPSPLFRNVANQTAYVGDSTCASCHLKEATVYRDHAMAQSFHRWDSAKHLETTLDKPLHNTPTGFDYTVVEEKGRLYQVEMLTAPGGQRLHELKRRIDYVMGSGHVAASYFTEENGRLFQLPLTWYRNHGWDFSPGYEINNARFDRLLPDRCISCHASYPKTLPYLEGKYAELRSGIGCERCHGPGALHVAERRSGAPHDSSFDNTIVNPARMPLERRLDGCEQCHVHTAVAVLRSGKDNFSYIPSQPLRDQWALFKVAGSIDVVSHADRLRQSKCFLATRRTAKPLECATCHNPHLPPVEARARNTTCESCHQSAALAKALASSPSLKTHARGSDCVSCHMPKIQERTVPHGTFTEHWIRVPGRDSARLVARSGDDGPIDPFFQRDRTGPESAIYKGMGEIVYASLANNARVLSDGAAALHIALGNDTTRGDAHFLLGVAYQQLGSTDESIRALERAVRIDSNRPEARRALAQAYERAGRPAQDVERQYDRALSLQPALAWIRAEYADYLQGQGKREAAKAAYRSALAEQPSLSTAWFNLGTVLAEEGKLKESSDAFQEAVHLDPALAQALTSLFEMHTRENVVTNVRSLGSPLASLPVRERGPRAIQLKATNDAAPGVQFINVPSPGVVQIMKTDGTLLRDLPVDRSGTVFWDLRVEGERPVAGGLYRARVQGRDASGRTVPPQLFYFALVRQRAG